jgi:hypothetical protein
MYETLVSKVMAVTTLLYGLSQQRGTRAAEMHFLLVHDDTADTESEMQMLGINTRTRGY